MKIKHIRLNSYTGAHLGKENQNNIENIPIIPPKKTQQPEKPVIPTINTNNYKLNPLQAKQSKKDKKTYLQLHIRNNVKPNYLHFQSFTSRDKIDKVPKINNLQASLNSINSRNLQTTREKTLKSQLSLKQKDDDQKVNILHGHTITSRMRAKMVDWIIEVLSTYKYHQQTFFLTVSIMDLYFQKNQQSLPAQDLHIIGLVSIFIASKFEEVKSIRLKELYEEIGHKKIPKAKILQKQSELLNSIQFLLLSQNPYLFMNQTLDNLSSDLASQQKTTLIKHSVYILKMAIYDPIFYHNQSIEDLAYGSLIASIQVLPNQYAKLQKTILKNVSKQHLTKILATANELCEKARNFQTNFPNLTNLPKNHTESNNFKKNSKHTSSFFI